MRPTQDVEVCTHCGDRDCTHLQGGDPQTAIACLQRQIQQLRAAVAQLASRPSPPRRDQVIGPGLRVKPAEPWRLLAKEGKQ